MLLVIEFGAFVAFYVRTSRASVRRPADYYTVITRQTAKTMSESDPIAIEHPSAEELHALFGADLEQHRRGEIESHLLECDECCARLDELSAAGEADQDRLVQLAQEAAELSSLKENTTYQDSAVRRVDDALTKPPERVGRYRIEKILGKGGFGVVYLAYDEQLKRPVAVKVPHANGISKPEHIEAFLAEARTVAALDHPGIVPVHDVGSTDDYPCYIVSKYIEGTDLAATTKASRLAYRDSAELVASVAEALHCAHDRGLVHRDVKPGNILMDVDGRPHVVDFGMALREDEIGLGPQLAGTPTYMSPEQAQGEGHRVDRRSDIFNLGVVLYQLLAGQPPFQGGTTSEVLLQVVRCEPKPLRQLNGSLPRELERICDKAMAKRPRDRYATAAELAGDLRQFLAEEAAMQSGVARSGTVPSDSAQKSGDTDSVGSTSAGSVSTSQVIRIVPKGLRSFDAHDADFFLQLLPGPTDRDGLPDSLRFWKTRIEETDSDHTFPVGLIYGPSGCGKSSLVKAGLLPRLSDEVMVVYIEATPEDTEARLLRGLRKRCPTIDENQSLTKAIASLRHGRGIPVGKNVLIVLDQFEQWLHTKRDLDDSELVQALRQCDGGQVQCIVMVRDDFWMAATRFLRELEVCLVEADNAAAVDLFPVRHAEKVLAAIGRAFEALPEDASQTSKEQQQFLKQSVDGLAEDGNVICVRLALFAEMMKGRVWTPATLKKVGGTAGVGVTFLEETFSSANAPPEHRLHQNAARAVLKDLLPDSGTGIKGSMRSQTELQEASGYGSKPDDFDDLIRILDSELRLITPTDPIVAEGDDEAVSQTETSQKYFQLAHDYLVHSLREWLTSKQKETRRGRAELRLFDQAVTWNARPENRFLPSWSEHLNLRLFTDRKKWTDSQRKMMGRAGRVHGVRTTVAVVALALLVTGGISIRNSVEQSRQELVAKKQEQQNDAEAKRLVEGLLKADTSQVESVIGDLDAYRQWANDNLQQALQDSPEHSNARLHAALALLPVDDSVLPFLQERLLTVSPAQFGPVRNLLAKQRAELLDDYWKIALDDGLAASRRFQAACALAGYAPDDQHWQEADLVNFIASHMTEVVLPSALAPWKDALLPVKDHLKQPLSNIFKEGKGQQERAFATDILSDYASDDPDTLFDLLKHARHEQFEAMFERLFALRDQAIELAHTELIHKHQEGAETWHRDHLAGRKANAAVMLLRMGASDRVWPLLKHSPEPGLRSYIINRLAQLGGSSDPVISRFHTEPDVTIRRALLLCLGEFDPPEDDRPALIESLLAVYHDDPDAGVHAAADWLLRQWEEQTAIDQLGDQWMSDRKRAEGWWQNQDGTRPEDQPVSPAWYVNAQNQTFAVLDGDEFLMGSSLETDPRHDWRKERLHRRRIGRQFAIASTEVTRAQWRPFAEAHPDKVSSADHRGLDAQTADHPMAGTTWYESAWYCNWLSHQEGIPEEQWCYEPNEDGDYGPGMTARPEFWRLTGYRLPTEAEWEFACRAGASSSRYFGLADTLLPKYSWHASNSENQTWPVASLKPNDFGLFDMHGNVTEWVYDAQAAYPATTDEAVDDAPATETISDSLNRQIRGNDFYNTAWFHRSAQRMHRFPTTQSINLGFRVARTFNLSLERGD